MRTIQAKRITKEEFAAFGELINFDDATKISCNQGRAIRYHDLAQHIDVIEGNGRAGLSIYRTTPSQPPFLVEVMERHPLGSQAFIPMTMSSTARFLVSVAPYGELDLSKVKSFVVNGQQGVNYKKGIWHLPIVALDQPLDFIALDRIGVEKNCDEVFLEEQYVISI